MQYVPVSQLLSESTLDRLHGCGERDIDVQERDVGEVFSSGVWGFRGLGAEGLS